MLYTIAAVYLTILLLINILSPLKVGLISWFQLLYVKLQLKSALITIKSVSLQLRPTYLLHLSKLRATDHDGLITIHLWKVVYDVAVQKSSKSQNAERLPSSHTSNLNPQSVFKIVKFLKWFLPITIVVHSFSIVNSSLPNSAQNTIHLDTLKFSIHASTVHDENDDIQNQIKISSHLNISNVKIGNSTVLENCKWTVISLLQLNKLNKLKFNKLSNTCIAQGLNVNPKEIGNTFKKIFPKTERKAKIATNPAKKDKKIDFDDILDKIGIESIYFAFDKTKIVLNNIEIKVRDAIFGLHRVDANEATFTSFSKDVHKLTFNTTNLFITPLNLSKTKSSIEFLNFSTIWNLKGFCTMAEKIDNTEFIKDLCNDEKFIAKTFLTITNSRHIILLDDVLLLLKNKKSAKRQKQNNSVKLKSETCEEKSQKIQNMLMILDKIKSRAQILNSCVELIGDDVSAKLVIDDIHFDSSFTDNISSLFESEQDSFTPTKASVHFIRNIQLMISYDSFSQKLVNIDKIQLSVSSGLDVSTDKLVVHDMNIDIDTIEGRIDDVKLIKKVNVMMTKVNKSLNAEIDEDTPTNEKEEQDEELTVVEESTSSETETETETETLCDGKRTVIPRFIQNIHFSLKKCIFVACFTNPVKYWDGIDQSELNNYKRGLVLSLRKFQISHDNTQHIPVVDFHLSKFAIDIVKDYNTEKHHKNFTKFLSIRNFKTRYTRFNSRLSIVVPIVEIDYSVEVLWNICFVLAVFKSIRGKKSESEFKPKTGGKAKSSNQLNILVKIHLVMMKIILPTDVNLAIELDSLLYTKIPSACDYSRVGFRVFRIYCENPHTPGMWTMLMILDHVDMKIKNKHLEGDEPKIDLVCEAWRIEIPFEYIFYRAFDNLKALLKSQKKINANFARLMEVEEDETFFKVDRIMPSIVDNNHIMKLPKIRVRANHFLYCNHDDPFEEQLTSCFMLGKVEQVMRLEKIKAFEKYEKKANELLKEKYGHILDFENGVAVMPTGFSDKHNHGKPTTPNFNMKKSLSSNLFSDEKVNDRYGKQTRRMTTNEVTSSLVNEYMSDAFEAWLKYKFEYHEVVEVLKSRLCANLSKSWITRVKCSELPSNSSTTRGYFKSRSVKDPDVRLDFFKKFPVVAEGTSHPLFGFDICDLDWTIDAPSFGIENYAKYMNETAGGVPFEMKYGIFFPMNWNLAGSYVKVNIKDYPLPLIGLGDVNSDGSKDRVVFKGDFVVFEQEYVPEEIRYNYVPCVSQLDSVKEVENLYALHIARTMTTVKIVTNLDVDVITKKPAIVSWSPSLQPGLGYAMNSFDLLSKPPLDTSPKIGFWDKLPLMLHGNVTFNFSRGLDLFIKSTQSPYDMTGRNTGFVFRWTENSKLKLNSTGKSKDFLRVESEIFEIVIPEFDTTYLYELLTFGTGTVLNYSVGKTVLKLTSKPIIWTLGFVFERNLNGEKNADPGSVERTNFFRPHYDVTLRNPDSFSPNEDSELWDSYEGWRSDYMFMSISVYSRDTSGCKLPSCVGGPAYNALSLTPLTFWHFLIWWSTFKSSLGLPIKEGALFKNKFLSNEKSPKFGKHLFGISYSVDLSPLYLAHMYRYKMPSAKDNNVYFVGLKCFVKSFTMDLHQSKREVLSIDSNTEKIRKDLHLKMVKGIVDFVESDIRIVTTIFRQESSSSILGKRIEMMPSSTEDGFLDSDESMNSDFCTDRNWYDQNDFIELSAPALTDNEPDWKMLYLASSPRFYYVREAPETYMKYPYDHIEKQTHDCQIGKREVSNAASSLAESRLTELQNIIDFRKNQIADLEKKPVTESLRKLQVSLQIELKELYHRVHILRSLNDKFNDGIFPDYDEFINDYEISEDSLKSDSELPDISKINSRASHLTHLSMAKSKISSIPLKSSNFRNRFIVYMMTVRWTHQTKMNFMSYLEKVRDRRYLVFSMSQKAVNLAESLLNVKSRANHDPNGTFDKHKVDVSEEFEFGKSFLDDFDATLHDTGDVSNAETDDNYLLKFIFPQFCSSNDSKSCVLMTCNEIVLRNVEVKSYGKDNELSQIALPVEDRIAVTLSDAFAYVLEREHVINGEYKFFSPKDSLWPPKLPLEMYYCPGSLGDAMVIQNLSCILLMYKPNNLHYSQSDNSKATLKKTVRVIMPDIEATMNSKQYSILYDLIQGISKNEKTKIQKVKDSVKNYVKFSDFDNYDDIKAYLIEMQVELRQVLLCKKLMIIMQTQNSEIDHDIEVINVELERLQLHLNAIVDYLQQIKAKKCNDSYDISSYNLAFPAIRIRLVDVDKKPFLEFHAIDVLYVYQSATDESSRNYVYALDVAIFDKHVTAVYNTVVQRFGESDNAMVEMEWALNPPVGGIQVVEYKKYNFDSLDIAVDIRMAKELQRFLFPESKIVNDTESIFDRTSSSSGDLDSLSISENSSNFSVENPNDGSASFISGSINSKEKMGLAKRISKFITSSHVQKIASANQKCQQDFDDKFSKVNKKIQSDFGKIVKTKKSLSNNLNMNSEEHVTEMKTRAKKYFLAKDISIQPIKLCVTFKGQGALRLINLVDFAIETPLITFHDRIFSNDELFAAIRNKLVRAVLKNAHMFIKSHLRPKKHRTRIPINAAMKIKEHDKNEEKQSHVHQHHSHHHFKDADLLEPLADVNDVLSERQTKPRLTDIQETRKLIHEDSVFKAIEDVQSD
ncbi:hypothetical protein DAMA08_019230 [Martiniozyma asiatica (nom. inval.)]|nr:hypothetical protein DAMA08_019230 [Martiniozyma asiatica]